jgi:hypothetical protein
MAVISNLAAVTILASEQTAVAAIPPYEDAAGTLRKILNDLNKIKIDLAYLNGNMPAGLNATAIATVITNLA